MLAPSHGTLEATEHALSVCVAEGGDRRVLYFALRHAPTRRACVLAVAKPDNDIKRTFTVSERPRGEFLAIYLNALLYGPLVRGAWLKLKSLIPYKNGYMYMHMYFRRGRATNQTLP